MYTIELYEFGAHATRPALLYLTGAGIDMAHAKRTAGEVMDMFKHRGVRLAVRVMDARGTEVWRKVA